MKVYIILYFILIFVCRAHQYSMLDPYKDDVGTHYNDTYFFLSFCVLFVAVTRHLVKTYEVTIPYSVFCIFLGLVWGVAALYNQTLYSVARPSQTNESLATLATLYLPLLIYSSAYSLDIHAFYKSIVQIMVISLPVALISACVVGLMVNLVSDTTVWTFPQCVLFGIITSTIYPNDVVFWLKESSVQTKYINVILHGESLLTTYTAIYVTGNIHLYTTGWVLWWYQFFLGTLRMFIFGVPMGYVVGYIGVFGMKFSYNNTSLLMFLTIVCCYTSCFFGRWFSNTGFLPTMITGIVMSLERCSLSQDAQNAISSMWKMIMCMANGIIFIIVGIRAPSILAEGLPFKEFILVFVTYLASNIGRFLGFFFVMPLLSHTGYGMTFKHMIICVWCGLKNPMCLTFILHMPSYFPDEPVKIKQFFLHIFSLYLLVQCINGAFIPVLLRALGLSEISTSRQANMNISMKRIYDARARAITILKMDRFLSDANWPMVLTSTSMKHPYKKMYLMDEQIDANDEEELFFGYKYTFCPDCQRHIPNQPTPREMREMTREAKMRVLKLKKTIYSRRYENGLLSLQGLRTFHHAVEIALDSEEAIIELDGLFQLFAKEGHIYRYLQLHLQDILRSKVESYNPPRRNIRFLCYKLMKHWVFIAVIRMTVVGNAIYVILETIPSYKERMRGPIRIGLCFWFIDTYCVEFVVKILGYSWVSIWRHGIPAYFRSCGHIIEFVNLICVSIAGIFAAVAGNTLDLKEIDTVNIVCIVSLCLRILHILTRLKVFTCCKGIGVSLLKWLDQRVNRHKALAYELGTNCMAAEAEVLDNMGKIIDNDTIRKKIKEKTESDRHAVCQKLTLAQKERAWVASTVKTKTSMRAVLIGMKDELSDLKVSGRIDDIEYNKLCASLSERAKQITITDFIEPASPRLLFNEIPYMGTDEEIVDFLWSNVGTRKYDPGNVVVNEGELTMGVYLVITGSFLVSYTPNETITQALKDTGALPVVDYITSNAFNTFKESVSDYFGPGNTIGELSALTRRTSDGKVIAQSHSEAYFISSRFLQIAMKMDDDPIDGLACRIWKSIACRIAVDVLTTVLTYRTLTRVKICFLVERAFVPDLFHYKIFVVSAIMQDLVLIEGIVVDFNTREVYTAPCYIPRTVQKLILPQSSALNVELKIETKLLIIPAKHVDKYEIMLNMEETCELIDPTSMGHLKRILLDDASPPAESKSIMKTKGAKVNVMRERALRKKLLKSEEAAKKIMKAAESGMNSHLSRSSQLMRRKPAELNVLKS